MPSSYRNILSVYGHVSVKYGPEAAALESIKNKPLDCGKTSWRCWNCVPFCSISEVQKTLTICSSNTTNHLKRFKTVLQSTVDGQSCGVEADGTLLKWVKESTSEFLQCRSCKVYASAWKHGLITVIAMSCLLSLSLYIILTTVW